MLQKVRIGQPYERVLVDAKITVCRNPKTKYSDFSMYKESEVLAYGEDDWDEKYGDFDNMECIKNGDLVLSGREDKNGGMIVNKLVDIDAKWNGSGCEIYTSGTRLFYRVDLINPLPKEVNIEVDVDDKHRK